MKLRIISLLLILLLLLPLVIGCRQTPPPANEGGVPPTEGAAPEEPTDDKDLSADDHLEQKGYPLGFSISLIGLDGYGFNTADGLISYGTESKSFDFSDYLKILYYEMTERNVYAICESGGDLTYQTLAGEPPAEMSEGYRLTFTDNGVTYTIRTDRAALEAFGTRSDVSNFNGLLLSFSGFARTRYE
ncbi:MAG: hypothetical protein E7590_00580 [Ruminococcaceae bacterium]|nr:hypothetical protein [Oscillospiraceae bacterium]